MSYELGNKYLVCDNCGAELEANLYSILAIQKILNENKWEIKYISERTGTIEIPYMGMVNRVSNPMDRHIEYGLMCVLCARKEKIKKICGRR
jgi:hypothetical protein